MDYNADIPFEHQPAAGFYDTTEEKTTNYEDKAIFDARTNKFGTRRKDTEDPNASHKRRPKDEKQEAQAADRQAIIRAERLQKLQEEEQISKRRKLSLPAPQVTEAEVDEIVRIGKQDVVLEDANDVEDDIFGPSNAGGIADMLKAGFSNLPKPRNDFELVAPEEEEEEEVPIEVQLQEAELEDAGERERRIKQIRAIEEERALSRRSQVLQRELPRSTLIDKKRLVAKTELESDNPVIAAIAREYRDLVVSDALKYPVPDGKLLNAKDSVQLPDLEDGLKMRALTMIEKFVEQQGNLEEYTASMMKAFEKRPFKLAGL